MIFHCLSHHRLLGMYRKDFVQKITNFVQKITNEESHCVFYTSITLNVRYLILASCHQIPVLDIYGCGIQTKYSSYVFLSSSFSSLSSFCLHWIYTLVVQSNSCWFWFCFSLVSCLFVFPQNIIGIKVYKDIRNYLVCRGCIIYFKYYLF